MRKFKLTLLVGFIWGLSFSWLSYETVTAQKKKEPQKCQAEDKTLPKYRVGKQSYGLTGILLLRISIKPKYFNESDMRRLAKRLNQEFCHEQKVHVALFDSHKASKSGLRVFFYLREGGITEELRGFYDLDREKGTETIYFNTKRNNPLDEINLDLIAKEAEKK